MNISLSNYKEDNNALRKTENTFKEKYTTHT